MAIKTVPTQVPLSEFIASLPDRKRREEAESLAALLQKLSGEPPVLWGPSIVGFGSYRYRYESGTSGEMCRIGFSPRKAELVLYLVGGFERHAERLAVLGRLRTGKSCLYLKRLSDADPEALENLLKAELAYMDATYPRG